MARNRNWPDSLRMADWILAHVGEETTHLKLQKLAFYCYGWALGKGLEPHFRTQVEFVAWKHGPVCREIYEEYKSFGPNPVKRQHKGIPHFSEELVALWTDVLTIYARLDPFAIRNQSHLERPWQLADWRSGERIPNEAIKAHFEAKLKSGKVTAPEYLVDRGSFSLDGIPLLTYPTLSALAEALRRAK